MAEYVPITKELRDYTTLLHGEGSAAKARLDEMCDSIDAIHRSLEQENERLRDASKRGDDWIKLPVDADGVPIRAGDELFWKEDGTSAGRVTAIGVGERAGWIWLLHDGSNVSIGRQVNKVCHAKPDTWERIIEDAIRGDGGNYGCLEERFNATVPALVARCKALCERTREVDE